MIRLQFYLETGRAAGPSLVFSGPHYSAPASKCLESRRNKSDICWRRYVIRQCPPTQPAFQNTKAVGAALTRSEFNSITVKSLLSSSQCNAVKEHRRFRWTRERRDRSASCRCLPLPTGWGRTWPSSGCPPPSPPPQSSVPPPGAAGRRLPASPTDPTGHTVDGANIVNLRAKSRAVYKHSQRAFSWKVTDDKEAKQSSCFNEHLFTSPVQTWYGRIVSLGFDSF